MSLFYYEGISGRVMTKYVHSHIMEWAKEVNPDNLNEVINNNPRNTLILKFSSFKIIQKKKQKNEFSLSFSFILRFCFSNFCVGKSCNFR